MPFFFGGSGGDDEDDAWHIAAPGEEEEEEGESILSGKDVRGKIAELMTFQMGLGNDTCFICKNPQPSYIVLDFWTFVCESCGDIHRQLGFKTSTIAHTEWTEEDYANLAEGGNRRAAEKWLSTWNAEITPLPEATNSLLVREFIRKAFVIKCWLEQLQGDNKDDVRPGTEPPTDGNFFSTMFWKPSADESAPETKWEAMPQKAVVIASVGSISPGALSIDAGVTTANLAAATSGDVPTASPIVDVAVGVVATRHAIPAPSAGAVASRSNVTISAGALNVPRVASRDGGGVSTSGPSTVDKALACFCRDHASTEKRPKGDATNRSCAGCKLIFQTNYLAFLFCPGCSAERRLCMNCGAQVAVAVEQDCGTGTPATSAGEAEPQLEFDSESDVCSVILFNAGDASASAPSEQDLLGFNPVASSVAAPRRFAPMVGDLIDFDLAAEGTSISSSLPAKPVLVVEPARDSAPLPAGIAVAALSATNLGDPKVLPAVSSSSVVAVSRPSVSTAEASGDKVLASSLSSPRESKPTVDSKGSDCPASRLISNLDSLFADSGACSGIMPLRPAPNQDAFAAFDVLWSPRDAQSPTPAASETATSQPLAASTGSTELAPAFQAPLGFAQIAAPAASGYFGHLQAQRPAPATFVPAASNSNLGGSAAPVSNQQDTFSEAMTNAQPNSTRNMLEFGDLFSALEQKGTDWKTSRR
eukprot:TRINITY_DN27803_c0_g1_i2.p1 TRINITY_DN27803_c0_g1~~TRINITY_DN27803_c0_g1_i2.p1  ORF type:complete len:703 (+),score=115.55 TRINITY_DN27803_c0_g1_i2:174-2282(+)